MGAYKLSLHCVGRANNVLALKHIHQECQRVHDDAIRWVGVFRIHSPVKSLNHFPGISDTEVLELVAEGQFLRLCSEVLARHPPQLYLLLLVSQKTRLYLHPVSRVSTTSGSLDPYSLAG